MASSSSTTTTYDVFLSFRGEDVRYTFISFLHNALKNKGVNVFLDNEKIRTGERIDKTIVAAIQGSRISIPVFSENYANSKWCLNELVEIVKCLKSRGQFVLPIFFNVDPSDVRKQTKGSFAKAFQRHEKDLKHDIVKDWRDALQEIGNLKGEVVDHARDQAKVVDSVVIRVSDQLAVPRVSNHLAVHKQCIRRDPPVMEKPSLSNLSNQRQVSVAQAFQQHENKNYLNPYITKGMRETLQKKGNLKGAVFYDTRDQEDDLAVTGVRKKCIRIEEQSLSDSDSDDVEPDHPMRRGQSTQRDSRRGAGREAHFYRSDSQRPSYSGWPVRRQAPSPLVEEEEDDDSYRSDDDDDVHAIVKKVTISRNY